MKTSPRIHSGPAGAGRSRPMKPLMHWLLPYASIWAWRNRQRQTTLSSTCRSRPMKPLMHWLLPYASIWAGAQQAQ